MLKWMVLIALRTSKFSSLLRNSDPRHFCSAWIRADWFTVNEQYSFLESPPFYWQLTPQRSLILFDTKTYIDFQAACSEECSLFHQRRTEAAAAERVAELQERFDRRAATLEEMAEMSKALACDNIKLSSELIRLKREKGEQMKTLEILKDRINALQVG